MPMILEIIIKIEAKFLLIIFLFLIQILSFLVNDCQLFIRQVLMCYILLKRS
jgi:hypothetical protein